MKGKFMTILCYLSSVGGGLIVHGRHTGEGEVRFLEFRGFGSRTRDKRIMVCVRVLKKFANK